MSIFDRIARDKAAQAPRVARLPSPTEAEFADPWFDPIWDTIKGWDIDTGDGPEGATGNHAAALLRAVRHFHEDGIIDPTAWECLIGECPRDALPHGSDFPMRRAVEAAFYEVTGHKAEFIFSGWNARLNPTQRQIVEGDRRREAERQAEVAELKEQVEELREQREEELARRGGLSAPRTDTAVGDGVPSGDSARLNRTSPAPQHTSDA